MSRTQKVKTTLTIDGADLFIFKQMVQEQRTTPSVVIGQFIHQYISEQQTDRNGN